jgi:AcrR family transcriptional regulator
LSKQEVRAGTHGRRAASASDAGESADGPGRRGETPPRRRLSAAARRELIEQAATRVFAEHGYAGASIDEIARRSGVTPPVVYDHFASKLTLFTRLLERTRDELLAMWIRELGGDVDRRASLAAPAGRNPFQLRMERAFGAWARYV